MQWEDIIEHIMKIVLYVHFSHIVDHYINRHTPHYTIEHTRAKILVSALEH